MRPHSKNPGPAVQRTFGSLHVGDYFWTWSSYWQTYTLIEKRGEDLAYNHFEEYPETWATTEVVILDAEQERAHLRRGKRASADD